MRRCFPNTSIGLNPLTMNAMPSSYHGSEVRIAGESDQRYLDACIHSEPTLNESSKMNEPWCNRAVCTSYGLCIWALFKAAVCSFVGYPTSLDKASTRWNHKEVEYMLHLLLDWYEMISEVSRLPT